MTKQRWVVLIGVIIVGVALLIAAALFIMQRRTAAEVTDFDSCVAAEGTVMESHPEQCHHDGETYVNEAQQNDEDVVSGEGADDYIGLTEEEALEKARNEGVTARVVERDGESLPVTMDLRFGRHNFSVRDGEVYSVEVEGEGASLPSTDEE